MADEPRKSTTEPVPAPVGRASFGQPDKTGWSEERLVLTGLLCLALAVGIAIGIFVYFGGGDIG